MTPMDLLEEIGPDRLPQLHELEKVRADADDDEWSAYCQAWRDKYKRHRGRPKGTGHGKRYPETIPQFTAPAGSLAMLHQAAQEAGLSRAAYLRQVLGLEAHTACADAMCGASDCPVCHPTLD